MSQDGSKVMLMLRAILGPLESAWEAMSFRDQAESFTIIRYDSSLTKGQLRRMHSLIEDILGEELSEGDRH